MLILKDEEVREEISSALANIQQPVQGRISGVDSVLYLLFGNLVKAEQGTILFSSSNWVAGPDARRKRFRNLFFKDQTGFRPYGRYLP
jgi:hypothetical protein